MATNVNAFTSLSSVRDSLGYLDTPFKKGETQTTVEFEIDRGQSFWPTIVIYGPTRFASDFERLIRELLPSYIRLINRALIP